MALAGHHGHGEAAAPGGAVRATDRLSGVRDELDLAVVDRNVARSR